MNEAAVDFLKGEWLKHPLHPAIVHVPVALWPAATVFDLLSRLGWSENTVVRVAFYAIAVGLAAAVLAVPTGLADWSGIKQENRAWRIGLYHMILNLLTALVFAINFGIRFKTFMSATQVSDTALIFSGVGTILLLVSAYLGGTMVYSYGINVGRQSKEKWKRIAKANGANLPGETNR